MKKSRKNKMYDLMEKIRYHAKKVDKYTKKLNSMMDEDDLEKWSERSVFEEAFSKNNADGSDEDEIKWDTPEDLRISDYSYGEYEYVDEDEEDEDYVEWYYPEEESDEDEAEDEEDGEDENSEEWCFPDDESDEDEEEDEITTISKEDHA